ncbi:MAG TPA: ATP-binding protein, partial [Armatimonadota bacterium]|nr:ATP-binding protein [Armatimonadota bacterium]
LAHELRAPLAPIVTAAEVLRLRGPLTSALERQRSVIARQARHLARMVEDLLDVARITQGKVTLRLEALDLRQVVEQALEVCQPLIRERGQHLEVRIPEEPLPLRADATRLMQAVCNLLNNAAKYSPPGGQIRLYVEAERPASAPHRVLLRVLDEGRGIPAELLPRVFDLFVQEDRSLDRAQGGLGIGLTLVRSLVEQHGGTVEARSDGPGKGSELIVRLPLAAGVLPPREAAPPSGPRSAPGARRVLVVDDSRELADSEAEMLSLWGYEVSVAYSGAEALAKVEQERPEAVLLDIGMPQMDGFATARALRSRENGGAHAFLVAITGYGQPEHVQDAMAAGFDLHLTKPVEPGKLREVLEQWSCREREPDAA